MEWLVAHKLFDDCMFVVHDHCVVFAKKGSSEDILSCSKLYIQRNIQEEKGIIYTTTTFTPHIAFSPYRAFTPKCGSTNLSVKLIHFAARAVDFVENHAINQKRVGLIPNLFDFCNLKIVFEHKKEVFV